MARLSGFLLALCCLAAPVALRAQDGMEWLAFTTALSPPGSLAPAFGPNEAFLVRTSSGVTFTWLAKTLGAKGELVLLHAGAAERTAAEEELVAAGLDTTAIAFFDVQELDTNAAGDYLPFFTVREGGLALADPKYYPNRPGDDAAGSRLAAAASACVQRPPLFLTRAFVDTDGAGLCVVSTKAYSTNPGLKQAEIDQLLDDYLGCEEIIPIQAMQGDGEGRIDVLFRFLTPTRGAIGRYEAYQDGVNKLILSGNRDKLAAALPASVQLSEIPMPAPVTVGTDMSWPSYLTFLVAGDTVYVPVYVEDGEFEADALDVLYDAYHPAFTVEKVEADNLAKSGTRLTSLVAPAPSSAFDTTCAEAALLCPTNDLSSCTGCFDECEEGDKECVAEATFSWCAAGTDGCLDTEKEACDEGFICKEAKCVLAPGPCDTMPAGGLCDDNLLKKCSGKQVITIDCWEAQEFCAIDEATGDAVCVPACGFDCGDAGTTPDVTAQDADAPDTDGEGTAGDSAGPESQADLPAGDTGPITAGYGKADDGCGVGNGPPRTGPLALLAACALALGLLSRGGRSVRSTRRLTTVLLALLFLGCADDAANIYSPGDDGTAVGTQDVSVPIPDTTDAAEPTADAFVPPPPGLARIDTVLAPPTVTAGEKSAVECLGFDANGAPIVTGSVAILAPLQVTVTPMGTGGQVSSTVAGVYSVSCHTDAAEVTENAATLTVTAGPAMLMSLALSPKKEYYAFADKITVKATGTDQYGNAVADVPIDSVVLDPNWMGSVSGTKVSLTAEGNARIWAYAATTSASEQIKVDNYGPTIEILSPKRAAAVQGMGNWVPVLGKATDFSGVASVTVNGLPVTVSPANGEFTTSVIPKVGINVLSVKATDGALHQVLYKQSFLYAGGYSPVSAQAPEEGLIEDGLVAWLDYDAFAGSNGASGTSFSYIVQQYLLSLDLAALVPSPAAQQSILWCQYDIYLENLQHGPVGFTASPAPGGLDVHVSVPDLYADVNAPSLDFACPDVAGVVTAGALNFDGHVDVSISGSGKLLVALTDVQAQFSGLNVDLVGVTGEILQAFFFFFKDSFTTMLEDEFEAQVAGQVEQQVKEFLKATDIDAALDVPPFMPGAPPAQVSVHARPSFLESTYAGITVRSNASFTASDTKGQGLPGAMLRADCLSGDDVQTDVEGNACFEVALSHDVLNQVLYSVWLDGGVDMSLDAEDMEAMGADLTQMGVEGVTVTTYSLLPPVAHDCGTDHAFRIEMGDMRMEVSMTIMGMPLEMTIYMYLSTTAGMVISGAPGAQLVEFQYGEVDWMEMYVEKVNDAWKGSEALFQSLVEDTFLPQFMDMLKKYPYVIPIAQISLSELLPSFPGSFTLVPVLDSIEKQEGQMLISAHLLLQY